VQSRQIVPSLAAFATILSDFLPIFLANIPFSRALTLLAHNICTWATVAVVCYMLVVIAVLSATVFRPGMYRQLPFDLSALSVVAVPVILAGGSPELLALMGDPNAAEENQLQAAKYGLHVGYEGDSTLHCGIEIM
jgi:hypothetical protein